MIFCAKLLLICVTANTISTRSSGEQVHQLQEGFSSTSDRYNADHAVPHNIMQRSAPDAEDNLGYFRDDVAMNSHHWNWHMVNSYHWKPKSNETRDRKGELFFHVHRQAIARYDAERISFNMPAVIALQNLRQPILEEYVPRFLNNVSSRTFISRKPNMTLQDVPSAGVSIKTLEVWSATIMEAIKSGFAFGEHGRKINLTGPMGIDILAAMIESSESSVNRKFYGVYHNFLHTAVSRISNPNYYPDKNGAMAYEAVSMRDPVFYRLHKHIDQIFEAYKRRLPPYSKPHLSLPNVTVEKVWVEGALSKKENILQTFWQDEKVYINRGILFDGIDPVEVKYRHLHHEHFNHNIQVTNEANVPLEVTVRLNVAPKFDHSGEEIPFNKQRLMFVELDYYSTTIQPGKQVLKRWSFESSVALPSSETFHHLACSPSTSEFLDGHQAIHGCGWPYHMLLPKGRTEGMTFTYFVMLTNSAHYNEDGSGKAYRYCGLLNRKYPDPENMGFPFDRMAPSSVTTAEQFAALSNMMTTEIVIEHKNVLIPSNNTKQNC